MIGMEVRGVREVSRLLQSARKEEQKALDLAIRMEAFTQRVKMKAELKAGRPGGVSLHPLSQMARRTKMGRLKKNQAPLSSLARRIRYRIKKDTRGGTSVSFGFVGRQNAPLSSSWKELLIKHQGGASVLYSGSRTELGRAFARIGGRLKKRRDPDARFFFLRSRTGRRINLPKREIVDPYWDAHEREAWISIRDHYRRKVRGERI